MSGWVLHVDLDQFLAAVEVLRRPELEGKPVVVGGRGDPTERGVVSTASYEARAVGVRSGMPLRTALARCPEAVFLPVDMPVYEEKSAQVMATLRGLSWDDVALVVQVLGWDEAFVAAPGATSSPQEFATTIRAAVLEATDLHCSVGVGSNKLQAKIATDFGKPRGVYTITDDTWFPEMGHRSVRALWGVGSKFEKRLAALGIATVADLAGTDAAVLAAEFGPTMGPWLRRLGRGVDTSPVDPTPWVARGHGREETFQVDLATTAEVEEAIRRITARVVADIDAEGRLAVRVGLKVRLRPFLTLNRTHKLPAASNDVTVLGDAAVALLDRLTDEQRSRPVRLIGVRLEMEPATS